MVGEPGRYSSPFTRRKAGMVVSERRGMNVYYRARAESLDALRGVLDPNCCR